jgi:hypothetical protein
MMDTGSPDVWVTSVLGCNNSQGTSSEVGYDCQNVAKYNHSISTTYSPDGSPYSMQYGAGNISGFHSHDTFFLGGM